MHPSVAAMWRAFARREGCRGLPAEAPSVWHFCDNERDANTCARLVRAGRKRATAPSLWWFEHHGKPLPQPADLHVVTDWAGVAQCVIQTQRVEIVPFDEVTTEHAAAEGEGDCTLESWRRTHRDYYRRERTGTGAELLDDMPVVFEHFECVYPSAVRPAVEADFAEMHRVRMSVRENELSDPSKVQLHHYREMLERGGRGWIAAVGGRIAGFAVADLEQKDIWALFVEPQHEGHGIGRQLQDVMLDAVFDAGLDRIGLATTAGTRAERFYLASGWHPIGRDPHGDVRFEMTPARWRALISQTPEAPL